MKKLYFLVFIALVLANPIWIAAQNANVPHVTHIHVESSNNFIRITWVDSPDANGSVYIFRSARPYTGSIPANIRPILIPYGVQTFIDDTEDLGYIHYFIAASDKQGQRYDLIIPRVNSASINFVNEGGQRSIQILEIPVATPQIQGLSNLRAVQNEDRIVITYDVSAPDPSRPKRNVIIYRSMNPVRAPSDLLNAVIVQSGISSPFTDFPVPGISWYYAVVFEDEISSGNIEIKPDINSTVAPVSITSAQVFERSLRPIPLPMLTLRNTMPEGFFTDMPEQIPLSPNSVNILRSTQMPDKAPIILKSPRVFSVDLELPAGGEESALFQIITDQFIHSEWVKARESLQHYLSSPRSKDIEIRARFYLGQTLYFTGIYGDALIEFLAFRTHYPDEAAGWIEAVLTAMVF